MTGRPYQSPARCSAVPDARPPRSSGRAPSPRDSSTRATTASSTGLGVGRHQHRGVADRLDQPHRRVLHALDGALELAHERAQLLGRDLLAQLREADDVDEPDRDRLRAGQPAAAQLGLADDHVSQRLAQVQVEHVAEGGGGQRAEVLKRLRVAQAQVALGVAGAQERLAEDRAQAGGDVGHRPAHDARQVEELLAAEAGVQQRGGALGQLEVVLGQYPLVRVDRRRADARGAPPRGRRARGPSARSGRAGCSAALPPGRARPAASPAGPRPWPGAAPRARSRLRERLQQLEAGLSGPLVLQAVEQALSLEVDRHDAAS